MVYSYADVRALLVTHSSLTSKDKPIIETDEEGGGHFRNLSYLSDICLEGLNKAAKILHHDSRCSE